MVSDEIGSTMGETDLLYERMRQESEVYGEVYGEDLSGS